VDTNLVESKTYTHLIIDYGKYSKVASLIHTDTESSLLRHSSGCSSWHL